MSGIGSRISPLGPGAGTAATGRAGRSGSGGGTFRLPAEGAAEAADSASGPAEVASVGLGLLSLQAEADDGSRRNARARRRAELMLEELRQLQAELLLSGGAPDPERLARLAALAEGEAAADPALQEIVEGISVRVRVEAARAAKRGSSGPK
jgi:hypothetical protein